MMSPAMFPLLLTLGVFTSVVFCDSDHHDHGEEADKNGETENI